MLINTGDADLESPQNGTVIHANTERDVTIKAEDAAEKWDPWTFCALSDMKASDRFPRWRSALEMEDYMVAAMMKRLMYEGQAITNVAAYHAMRDALGCLISRVKIENPDLAAQIDNALESSDGSGGDARQQPPPPNP